MSDGEYLREGVSISPMDYISPEAREAAETCKVPPEGWWCSREAGHEGPCAARPVIKPSQIAQEAAEAWFHPLKVPQLLIDNVALRFETAITRALDAQTKELARLREDARKDKALIGALQMDFNGMRDRFCDHHGTPGAVAPKCPECERNSLRAENERLTRALMFSERNYLLVHDTPIEQPRQIVVCNACYTAITGNRPTNPLR